MIPPSSLHTYRFRADAGILFNPDTGIEISLNESATAIAKALLSGESPTEIAMRFAHEYAVPRDEVLSDIQELLRYVADPPNANYSELEKSLSSPPTFPFAIEFELTQKCNWNCSFCYNSLRSCVPAGQPDFLDHDLVIRVLDECAAAGLLRVRYSGGEPTLHPRLGDFIRHAHDLGLYQVVFTNGSRLEPKRLTQWHQHGVREVMLSLHGPRDIHDALVGIRDGFLRVCSAVRACTDAGLRVVLEMTLVRQNEEFVQHTLDIAEQLGVSEFRIMRYVPRGASDVSGHSVSDERFADIVEQVATRSQIGGLRVRFPCSQRFCISNDPKPIRSATEADRRSSVLLGHCQAGLNWMSVSQSGELRLCPHAGQGVGSLRDGESICALWSQCVKPTALGALSAGKHRCVNCLVVDSCAGGCPLRYSASPAA